MDEQILYAILFVTVRPALKLLHWLPVEVRISYKLLHAGQARQYLTNCVYTVTAAGDR